jgi:type II secretory pathway component PulM
MMLDRLHQQWDSLAAREQRMLQWGGACALVLLLLAVQLPLQRKLQALRSSIATHLVDAAWLRANGPQLAALGPALPVSTASESLLVRVDRSAREAGLGAALVGSQPAGDGALRVQLQAVRFNAVVTWLAAVADQQGIAVDTATFDAAAEAGLVNATLVLRSR